MAFGQTISIQPQYNANRTNVTFQVQNNTGSYICIHPSVNYSQSYNFSGGIGGTSFQIGPYGTQDVGNFFQVNPREAWYVYLDVAVGTCQ